MTIKINESLLGELIAHLEGTFPNEGCGFFFGKDEEERVVTSIRPVENSKQGDQRRRFEISALDYIRAERFALENGLVLLGIYHSHPNHPAQPSEHDLRQAVPYFSYLIASIYDGKFKEITSWQLEEEGKKFKEEIVLFEKNEFA